MGDRPVFLVGVRYESGYQWVEGFTLESRTDRAGVFVDDFGDRHRRKIHPASDELGEYAKIGHSGLFAVLD